MAALAVTTFHDGVLAAVAPLGLAASAGTALLVDLDPAGPDYPGEGSLAALVEYGPRRADLRPVRRGVAVLRNGGIEASEAVEVLAALVDGWPAVVVRRAVGAPSLPGLPVPTVPVIPMLPAPLRVVPEGPAVYQPTGLASDPPGPGHVLARLRAGQVAQMLRGMIEQRWRWVRSWAPVWSLNW